MRPYTKTNSRLTKKSLSLSSKSLKANAGFYSYKMKLKMLARVRKATKVCSIWFTKQTQWGNRFNHPTRLEIKKVLKYPSSRRSLHRNYQSILTASQKYDSSSAFSRTKKTTKNYSRQTIRLCLITKNSQRIQTLN